jgi:hypothetical protein
MSDPQRRLLPYEHQLIEALGITKEQYLDFVAQQQIYSDPKEGTVLDARNWEVVAIVLAVVGIIFQVVSALIAPQPQAQAPRISGQQGGGGVASSRDEIFAPRFGFNTQQQLAAYGDPINLVYTNTDTNPSGGVRVATSLIWSAILSYGNSQLVRLMFVLCAGGIGRIDEEKSAFGQTALRDLVAQNYWLYFAPNYTGFLQNSHVRPALNGLTVSDPTTLGSSNANPYLVRSSSNGTSEGFSHCYSPSTANVFGIYGAVPINVQIRIRNAAGYFEDAINGVQMSVAGQNGYTARQTIPINTDVVVQLLQASSADEGLAPEEAKDSRRVLVSVFDNSGVFKFGSTKLKAISANRGDIIDGGMVVNLKAVEQGRAHSVNYGTDMAEGVDFANAIADTPTGEKRRAWEAARSVTNSLLSQDARPEINSAQALLNDGRIYSYGITGYSSYQERRRRLVGFRGYSAWEYYTATVTTPNYGYIFQRNITSEERNALQSYISLNSTVGDDALSGIQADLFYTKALVRIEEASYETISPCNLVDFSLKARVFKRVNGRQEEYGSSRVGSGYRSADNGLKYRSMMFLIKVKRAQDSSYTTAPAIFVVRRSADIENFIYLRFRSGTSGAVNAQQWQFKFEPVYDVASEIVSKPQLVNSNGETIYCYLENTGNEASLALGSNIYTGAFFDFIGTVRTSVLFPAVNEQPAGLNEWDVFSNTSDSQIQFSFDNGPEMSLAAVTEQIIDPYSNYSGLYDNISLIGLNMYSGKSVQDLRSFSVFAEQGRLSRLLRTSGTVGGIGWGQPGFQYLSDTANGYANTAPDIFVDTVLDVQDGIGRHASIHSIDLEQLAKSKKFCETNSLFMDGIIAEPSSWRQFWAQFAAFSLLELAKVGGQDVLIPAVPYVPTTGAITRTIPITALFNQGNIIEESYKEEFIDYGENTQDMIVTVIYRKTDNTGVFNVNTSVDVQLADVVEESAARKTIDASAFVTRRDQAIKLGKFLCNSKRYSQRACEFKTFPTDSPVFPGAYVYVELAHNQWDGIYTGIIEDGGFLNMPITASIPNGSSYSMLIYSPDGGASSTQSFTGVTIGNNRASIAGNTNAFQNYVGKLFVVGTVVNNKRIFRVTEVQMDEEGEVTVRGVHHATDANGLSLISRGIVENISGLFLIDGRPE